MADGFWRIGAVSFIGNRFELANSGVEREGYKRELAGNGGERGAGVERMRAFSAGAAVRLTVATVWLLMRSPCRP